MGMVIVYILAFVVSYFTCQLIFEAIHYIVFSRLRAAKWYIRLAGEDKKNPKPNEDTNKIGF
jgi:hypothetical protein